MNFVSGGGSVLDLDLTARTWQQLGHTVEFITVFPAQNDFPSNLPYKIHEEPTGSPHFLPIQYGIFRILKKYAPQTDIFYIECHGFLYGAGLYRRLGGSVPVVAFFNRELTAWPEDISTFFYEDRPHPQQRLFDRLKKKLRWYAEHFVGTPVANGMDLLTYTNPILKKEYEDFGLHPDHSVITGDPFDFETMMQENNMTENSYRDRNKHQGPFVLFYSSRMAPGKGFDLLITAFSKVKNKDNFRLILGGNGPEEENVRKKVRELGLDTYVELPGWVSKEELFASLKKVDMFIQPRWRRDMTSTSLLFAMAFGLPCILPGGGGLEWVAKESAVYFQDNDPEDLARKIEALGDNRDLRATLSANCYRRLQADEMYYKKTLPLLAKKMEALI